MNGSTSFISMSLHLSTRLAFWSCIMQMKAVQRRRCPFLNVVGSIQNIWSVTLKLQKASAAPSSARCPGSTNLNRCVCVWSTAWSRSQKDKHTHSHQHSNDKLFTACTSDLSAYWKLCLLQWNEMQNNAHNMPYINTWENYANRFVQVKNILYMHAFEVQAALDKCLEDLPLTKDTIHIQWVNS